MVVRTFSSHHLVAGALLVLSQLGTTACIHRTVAESLEEREAREIAVVLQRNQIPSKLTKDRSNRKGSAARVSVEVVGGDRTLTEAFRVLEQSGLPRQPDRGFEEVFADEGFIPTASQEKARFLAALSGEFSKTLKTIPGVSDARVHIVLPENSPLSDQKAAPMASVVIRFDSRYKQMEAERNRIAGIVAGGVQALKPENVHVYFYQAPPLEVPNDKLVQMYVPTGIVFIEHAFLYLQIGAAMLLIRVLWSRSKLFPRWYRKQYDEFRRAIARPRVPGSAEQLTAGQVAEHGMSGR